MDSLSAMRRILGLDRPPSPRVGLATSSTEASGARAGRPVNPHLSERLRAALGLDEGVAFLRRRGPRASWTAAVPPLAAQGRSAGAKALSAAAAAHGIVAEPSGRRASADSSDAAHCSVVQLGHEFAQRAVCARAFFLPGRSRD